MRFHDFHLVSYTVAKSGAEITLELVYDYPDQPVETSWLRFADVAAYHFIQTGGTIIMDIMQIPVSQLLQEVGNQLKEWFRLHGGYIHWNDDPNKYAETLVQNGYEAWKIYSAPGFEGFVIAKAVKQVEKA